MYKRQSINSRTGLSDWQAYRVLADSVGVASLLPRVWYEDSLVSPNVASADVIDDDQQFVQALPIDVEERSYQLNEIKILPEDQGRLVPMSSFAGTPYWVGAELSQQYGSSSFRTANRELVPARSGDQCLSESDR